VCRVFESGEVMAKPSDLVVEANTEQREDDAFVSGLCALIRFNAGQDLESRDGLYSGVMGSPARLAGALNRLSVGATCTLPLFRHPRAPVWLQRAHLLHRVERPEWTFRYRQIRRRGLAP
jgi:hypothetical protein